MKKITVPNEQVVIKQLTKSLANNYKGLARAYLNDIKSQAYNRKHYLEKKLKDSKITGIERGVIQEQYNRAKADYDAVSSDIDMIRRYIKDPQHIRINQAVNRLNVQVARAAARAKEVQRAQKQAGTVIGITGVSIAVNRKQKALLEHYVYNIRGGKLDDAMIDELSEITKRLVGFDLKQAIAEGVAKVEAFGSDDLFNALVDVGKNSIKQINAVKMSVSDEDRAELQRVINYLDGKDLT